LRFPRLESIVAFSSGLIVIGGLGANLNTVTATERREKLYALLIGTCFNEKGFRLPGVTIVVEMKSEAVQKSKKKRWKVLSNSSGEFALRLPAGRHTFVVSAQKKAVKPVEKTVRFTEDERQDVIFNMETISEKK